MKILLINPNTSHFITERMVDAAQHSVGGAATVTGITAPRGPAVVGSRIEDALAATTALELAAASGHEADAVLLGISTDAGLAPLRQLLDIPVVGMLEAAILTASQLGGRIGLLTLGERMLPIYQERIGATGLGARMVGWRGIELPEAFAPQPGQAVANAVTDHVRQMADEHALDVVVLAGAVLAGYRAAVQPRVPVPVVDGIEAAAWQAVALGALKPAAHQTGSYAAVRGRVVSGFSGPLVQRMN